MNMRVKGSFIALAALVALSSGASAATVTSFNFDNPLNTTPQAFDATVGTTFSNVTGSDLNPVAIRRSPWDTLSAPFNGYAYNSVQLDSSGTYNTSGNVAGALNTVALTWGSPDSYNTLQFLLGNSVVDSITGTVIGALPGATPGLGFVNVLIQSVAAFDSIKLISTGRNAFEHKLGEVPIPPAALLFGTALAGVGFMSRRKKAQTAA